MDHNTSHKELDDGRVLKNQSTLSQVRGKTLTIQGVVPFIRAKLFFFPYSILMQDAFNKGATDPTELI